MLMSPPRTTRIGGRADWALMTATQDAYAVSSSPGRLRQLPAQDRFGRLAETALWALVVRHARCSDSGLDPDQWFPVSNDPGRARQEAAAAIAICAICPVRGPCLALSLHRWDLGQHGVWGGLIAADRAQLRSRARPARGDHRNQRG
jgi:Transcription factor WhiB